MGRKQLPNEVKKLRGTDQPCRIKPTIKGEIITDISSIMNHPSVLLLTNDRQKQIFVEKANQLVSLKIMEEMYVDSLVQYAIYYDLWEQAVINMNEHGQQVISRVDSKGKVIGYIENPYIPIVIKYTTIIRSIGSDLGFTPVDRMKLPIIGKQESAIEQARKLFAAK